IEVARLVVYSGVVGASGKDRDVLGQWGRRSWLASGEDAVARGVCRGRSGQGHALHAIVVGGAVGDLQRNVVCRIAVVVDVDGVRQPRIGEVGGHSARERLEVHDQYGVVRVRRRPEDVEIVDGAGERVDRGG